MKYKVYSKTNCPSCVAAKQLLDQKGLDYEVLLFGKDYDLGDMMKINPSARTFPMITVVENDTESYIGGLHQLQQILGGS